jgi:hypothetical protein
MQQHCSKLAKSEEMAKMPFNLHMYGTVRDPWEHLEMQIRLPVAFGGGPV